MKTTILISLVAVLLVGADRAPAESCVDRYCVINNGDAPPNPENRLDATYSITDIVYVRNAGCPPSWPRFQAYSGCPSPGTPTEVEVVDGGAAYNLFVWESSKLAIRGGFIDYAVEAVDTATVVMSGGVVDYELEAHESASVTMTGGLVGYSVCAFDSATVEFRDGEIGHSLDAHDTAVVEMSGGTVGYQVEARGDSTLTMTGGTVKEQLLVRDTAEARVSGGTLEQRLECAESSETTLSGGVVLRELLAYEDSSIQIEGEHFMVDTGSGPEPVAYAALAAGTGRVTGTLASGDVLDVTFYQGGYTGSRTCSSSYPCSGTISLVAAPAAKTPFISNGEDPEANPSANTIDDATHEGGVQVRNAGCPDSAAACDLPRGSPTEVALVNGGKVSRLYVRDASSVSILGGVLSYALEAHDSATATLGGGALTGELRAFDSSGITVLGMHEESDFLIDGYPAEYGELDDPCGTLTGTLASGQAIDIEFLHADCDEDGRIHTGKITLAYAPEPGATALAACGLATLALLRRQASGRRGSNASPARRSRG